MYQLPNVKGFMPKKEIKETFQDWNLEIKKMHFLGDAKHVFTHIDWFMKGYMVEIKNENEKFCWASWKELDKKYALPTAFQKILKMEK